MKKQINVGLIGFKFMGRMHSNGYQHVRMFLNPSAEINMKAICGPAEEETLLKQAGAALGWQESVVSWEKLLERPDIDVIDITAPSNVHKEIAIKAAQAGKHVFCEKPLAFNRHDAFEMWKVAEQNHVRHAVGFSNRFSPAVQLAKKLITDGKIGRIFHFRGWFLQDWIIDPNFPLVWRLDKKLCGSGSLGDLGAHVIDLARFLVGELNGVIGVNETFIRQRPLVESMSGLSGKAKVGGALGQVTVDDATLFLARFENGALGSFESSRYANGHRNSLGFEINGSKGSLKFDLERLNELQYYSSDDPSTAQGFRTIQVTEPEHAYMKSWWPAGHVLGLEHTFTHELYEFLESVAHDRPNAPNFEDGVRCCEILDAVDQSIEEKHWIEIERQKLEEEAK